MTAPPRPGSWPANPFQLLLLDGMRGRRALAVRVGASLLLGFPLLFAPLPAPLRGAGLTALLLFVGLFGAVVGNTRLRTERLWERLRLLPLGRTALVLDVVAAGAVLDLVQTAPLLGLYLILHGGGAEPEAIAALAGFWCATLVFLNGLGMLIASRVRSNAEAHLFGALAVGFTALLSGLFPVPERIAAAVAWAAPLLPPRHFFAALPAGMKGGQGTAPSLAGVVLLGLTALAVWARATDRPATGRIPPGPAPGSTANPGPGR